MRKGGREVGLDKNDVDAPLDLLLPRYLTYRQLVIQLCAQTSDSYSYLQASVE